MLARLKLGQQMLDALLDLGEFRNERLAVHLSCIITRDGKYQDRRSGLLSPRKDSVSLLEH